MRVAAIIFMFVLNTNFIVAQSILVDPKEFNKILNDPAIQKLDVRSAIEFEIMGHIHGFEQINIMDKKFDERVLKKFDPDHPIMITCLSGHRSKMAVEKLEKLGFKKIIELKGGIINWLKKGYALE